MIKNKILEILNWMFKDLKQPIYKDWIFWVFIIISVGAIGTNPLGLPLIYVLFIYLPVKYRTGGMKKGKMARKEENKRVGYTKPRFPSLSSTFYLTCNHQILIGTSSDLLMTGMTVFCDVCQAERQITKRIEKRF